MSVRAALRAWRPPKPRQEVDDPCDECGTVLVLCVQCGVNARCVVCLPYERPTERTEEIQASVRFVRDHPEAGLLGGVIASLVPAMLVWAQVTYAPPGMVRILGTLAGAVTCCAFLAAGAAWSSLPLPGEAPPCRWHDPTPYDRWALAGTGALFAQIALVCIGVAAA
ncbi:hypothetical protein [Streptomyces sp.]|uniref:hypothetical protein n=1 Tax=Streptomyces sp. TaxID=1931 RepID=UPI002F3EAEB5